MARKIRLDFSKVEERSGWKTTHMEEGLYEMKVELVDDRDANDGTKMLTYGLRPTNPKYKTRLFPYYCKQQANQYFKLRDLHIAAGVLDPSKAKGKAVDIYPDAPIGKIIAAEVRDGTGQFSDRSEIDGVYDISILDGEEGEEPDDDEEYDEEDEVDEDEVDDEDEDEAEEEDDELREEIEALTLAALRKRAKGLGIDTDGVKKDDLVELVIEEELAEDEDEDDEDEDDLDDDDLDDDELEDEEFEDDEDEEEEEPPAKPARKAAAKAPAKSAKAAPAKRTVRRR